MKKLFTQITFALLFCFHLQAQVVTENVHFDFYQSASNNDLVNSFNNGLGMAQIQTSGITGGCITVPDSISWGNDDAIYCSHYHPTTGDTTVTSVCFKYDSTTVELSSYQRAISIFLHPSADFNHYVIATVSGDKKIELITYGWVNSPYPYLNLLHNHWYSYKLSTAFLSATQVFIKAEVFDLGLTGTSSPTLVNTSSGTITDNILAADTSIQVSVSATTYGGCHYLDDFSFHGRKGASNCVTSTGIFDANVDDEFAIHYSTTTHFLNITNATGKRKMTICILNAEGKKVLAQTADQASIYLSTDDFANGLYIVQCQVDDKMKSLKFILSR